MQNFRQIHYDLPRGGDSNTTQSGPSAAFLDCETIAATESLEFDPENRDGAIYLGQISSEIRTTRLEDGRLVRYAHGGIPIGVRDDRHMITVAGSRGGKGRSVIINNIIMYPGSMMIIDPKGELARETASYLTSVRGHEVVVLDPFSVTGDTVTRCRGGYNPMTILTSENKALVEDAGLIADALVQSDSSKDPHWDESAKQFLEGVILHVATSQRYIGKRNLVTVYDLLMHDVDDESGLRGDMYANPAADFSVIAAATNFYARDDRERSSVLSTLRRHVRFLGYSQMREVLTTHSIDLSALKNSKLCVYLSLPAMRMGTCSRWLRLFANMALTAFEAEKTKPRYPVLMILDEFAVLGRLKSIEDAAGQIAGLGCKLWPILQDIGQLQALYGKRWETFVGNAGVVQCFSNSDSTTLEWISRRLGDTTINNYSTNTQNHLQRAQGFTGHSWSDAVCPLMTAEEISRFFGRDDYLLRQLIIRPSFSPMILQRAYYDKHEIFQNYRDFMS